MATDFYQQAEEFFLNRLNTDSVFNTIERADYVFLYNISLCQSGSDCKNRAYLYKLAEQMDLPIPRVSRAVRRLQDKGYVTWKTDDELGRTYVKLTHIAIELMRDMKNNLQSYYQEVLDNVDSADLETTLRTLKQISALIAAKQAQQEEEDG